MCNRYFDEAIETASREKLREIQSERLIKTVKRCYEKVPFYKQKRLVFFKDVSKAAVCYGARKAGG